MTSQPVHVEREVLYEQVWSRPMSKLAQEYGISDVALAKICRKLKIPVPGRGYWQKEQQGKAMKPPKLPDPPALGATMATIGTQRSWKPATQDSEGIHRQAESEKDPANKIEVSDFSTSLHPILRRMRSGLRKAKPDEYGALSCQESRTLNLRVSKKNLDRALRILDTLYRALEQRGYRIALSTDENPKVTVAILGETIGFGVEERFQRQPLPPSQIKRSWWERDRYEYLATDVLSLRIHACTWSGLRQTWRDGKRQRIEELLNDFIVGLVKAAEYEKAQRLERERRHQEWVEAQRRRAELEEIRREEEARVRTLEQEAASWIKANQIRSYIDAAKAAILRERGEISPGSEADRWFRWARRHADLLDPLSRLERPHPPTEAD